MSLAIDQGKAQLLSKLLKVTGPSQIHPATLMLGISFIEISCNLHHRKPDKVGLIAHLNQSRGRAGTRITRCKFLSIDYPERKKPPIELDAWNFFDMVTVWAYQLTSCH
jgi:hypothetical protein